MKNIFTPIILRKSDKIMYSEKTHRLDKHYTKLTAETYLKIMTIKSQTTVMEH